jgi:hypothetical protein
MDSDGFPQHPQYRRVVDVLLVGGQESWSVMARPGDDHSDLFSDGGDPERTVPLLLCRSVGVDGVVVIGSAEPGYDLMLSELLLWDCPDEI